MKVPERLQPLVEQGVVDEVVRPLMSGKEASLFIVRSGKDEIVAKVYKDAKHRSFRQRSDYAEGRQVRNTRQKRAMEKGSKFGKEQQEEAWQNAEVDALYRLSAAGVRVPKPHMFTDGVLLMDLVVDADGEPAPRLWDVELTEAQAVEIHGWLVRQVVLILCAGMVHGDLSEYNVLIAKEGPTIIDLPQATDAAQNQNSKKLFLRDVDGLTRFLARFAPELATTHYGEEIWDLYERGRLFVDSPLTGKWKGATKKADTRAVLDEIATAAFDARERRERDGTPEVKRAKSQARARQENAPAKPSAPKHAAPKHAGPKPSAPKPSVAKHASPSRGRAEPAQTPTRDIDLDSLDALLLEDL